MDVIGAFDVSNIGVLLNLTASEQQELDTHEITIERGLKTFVDVGSALLAIRDKRLYRARYGTFEDYCQERWGMVASRARQLIGAAQTVTNVTQSVDCTISPANEAQARPLTRLEPEQQREAWQRAVETAPNGRVTGAHVQRVVDEMIQPEKEPEGELVRGPIGDYYDLGNGIKQCARCRQLWGADLNYCPYCHISREARVLHAQRERSTPQPDKMAVHFYSESVECYTPPKIIERTLQAMGQIDLDPCSNDHDNPNVPAIQHYTQEDDGLSQDWRGRVYMNPPYGREIADWVEYLCQQYESGNVTEAIALVPSRTDTQWFRRLREYPRCFVWGRLHFSDNEVGAPFPSMVVYLGKNVPAFISAFGDIGDIYALLWSE